MAGQLALSPRTQPPDADDYWLPGMNKEGLSHPVSTVQSGFGSGFPVTGDVHKRLGDSGSVGLELVKFPLVHMSCDQRCVASVHKNAALWENLQFVFFTSEVR